jgi:septum formation topological specificity factor MinE
MFRGRHSMEMVYGWMMFDLQLDPGIFLRSGVDGTDGKARTRLQVSLTVSAGSALTKDTTTMPSMRAILLEVLESFLAIQIRKLG